MSPLRSLKLVFLILLIALPSSLKAIPILDQISGAAQNPRGFLTIQLAGREHADAFRNVRLLIEAGNGAGLIQGAARILLQDSESSLAYEVRGTGNLILGNIVGAISDFENATRLDPTQGGAFAKLGLAYMEADQLDAAEQTLLLALELNPRDDFSHRNLGLLYDFQGESQLAISHLTQGLSASSTGFVFEATVLANLLSAQSTANLGIQMLEPRVPLGLPDSGAQMTLATLYLEAERWEEAISRFDSALNLNENSELAKLGRAAALRGAGRVQESITYLRPLTSQQNIARAATVELMLSLYAAGDNTEADQTRVAAINLGADPDQLLESIANQHLRDNRIDDAFESLQTLYEQNSGSPQSYVSFSELLIATGYAEQAVTVIETALERFPRNAYLAYRLGNVHAAMGNYPQAIAELQRADSLDPGNLNILRTLSLVQTRNNEHRDALVTALAVLELWQDVDTYVFVALAAERANQAESAIDFYEAALELEGNNALVLNNLASVLAGEGDLDRASSLSEQAVGLAQNNPLILDTLGSIRIQQSDYEAALDILEQAAGLEPQVAVVHYHLGQAYEGLNRQAEAGASYQQALNLDPDFSRAEEALQGL